MECCRISSAGGGEGFLFWLHRLVDTLNYIDRSMRVFRADLWYVRFCVFIGFVCYSWLISSYSLWYDLYYLLLFASDWLVIYDENDLICIIR